MCRKHAFPPDNKLPPRHKTNTCRKNLGELIFARVHAGLVFALPRIQENIFDEVFPEYSAKFLGEVTRREYMPRLYSHLREYRKIFLVNYLCIGFVPGVLPGKKKGHRPKLLGQDLFQWGVGLPREGVGGKKLGISLKTHGHQTVGRDIPGFFAGVSWGHPKSLMRRKRLWSIFVPYITKQFPERIHP